MDIQVKILVICVGLSVCLTACVGAPNHRCNPDPNYSLQEHFDSLNEGFNITQYFGQEALDDKDTSIERWINDSYKSKYGPSPYGIECPVNQTQENYPDMITSICPWYIELDFDPKRFPVMLPKAVGRCRQCIGSNGNLLCQPVRQTINVLKQVAYCGNGLYKYEPETEDIEVAYICSVQRFADDNTDRFRPDPTGGPRPL